MIETVTETRPTAANDAAKANDAMSVTSAKPTTPQVPLNLIAAAGLSGVSMTFGAISFS